MCFDRSSNRGVGTAEGRQRKTEDPLVESTNTDSSSDEEEPSEDPAHTDEEKLEIVNTRRDQRRASVARYTQTK